MRRAILLTAHNRPAYLADVLDSWTSVRGLEDWDFIISIDEDESEDGQDVIQLAEYFQRKRATNVKIVRHSPKLGVLKHPYVMFDSLFPEYDFILRTEDDLVVSDGILEYFEYAAETFEYTPDVKTIHGYNGSPEGEEQVIFAAQGFNPWTFGTWRRAWPDLKAEWDLDYSTYNGTPGNQSGFDWHYNTRVYPKQEWFGIYPEVSRVKNIGSYGVHGTPDNLPESPTFTPNNDIREGHFELQL